MSAPPPATGTASGQKSAGVAFGLLLGLGMLGAHRFYLGRALSGLAMLGLTLAGFVLTTVHVGWLLLAGVLVWLIADFLRLPAMIGGGQPGP